jgi:hypothetical protein
MTTTNAIYTKSPDVVYRKIADEFVLVPIRQKAVDLKSIFTLNDTAAFIWENIDGVNPVSAIIEKLAGEHEVELSIVTNDTAEVLGQFESLGFVKKI